MKKSCLEGFQLIIPDAGGILRKRRISLGLIQRQVAEKAGIPLQSYQRFESGERNIMTASFQMACRVIEALDMNISDFYHGAYAIDETD